MNLPANLVLSVPDRASDRKTHRQRDNPHRQNRQLTCAQRTDTLISYETEIAALVEGIRHLENTEELRHCKNIADSDR